MLPQSVLLALLDQHTTKPIPQLFRQHHARQPGVDVADCYQAGEVALGLSQWDWPALRRRRRTGAGVVDEIA